MFEIHLSALRYMCPVSCVMADGKSPAVGCGEGTADQFWLVGVGEGRGIAAHCPWLLWEAGAGEESGTAVQCSVVRLTA